MQRCGRKIVVPMHVLAEKSLHTWKLKYRAERVD